MIDKVGSIFLKTNTEFKPEFLLSTKRLGQTVGSRPVLAKLINYNWKQKLLRSSQNLAADMIFFANDLSPEQLKTKKYLKELLPKLAAKGIIGKLRDYGILIGEKLLDKSQVEKLLTKMSRNADSNKTATPNDDNTGHTDSAEASPKSPPPTSSSQQHTGTATPPSPLGIRPSPPARSATKRKRNDTRNTRQNSKKGKRDPSTTQANTIPQYFDRDSSSTTAENNEENNTNENA